MSMRSIWRFTLDIEAKNDMFFQQLRLMASISAAFSLTTAGLNRTIDWPSVYSRQKMRVGWLDS